MQNKVLVIIDIQNDITKNYKKIVENLNRAIDWAESIDIHVVYILHNNVTPSAKSFLPGSRGAELVPELKKAGENRFIKTKASALTSEAFCSFIKDNAVSDFIITGADATACVKSTCYNMAKAGYNVTVLSDCVASYDKHKIPEMLEYYTAKGCRVITLAELIRE